MCSHFSLTTEDGAEIADALRAASPATLAERYSPSSRVGPMDAHWLLRWRDGGRFLDEGSLGLYRKARSGLLINLRGEHVGKQPSSRDAYLHRRCLIPADSFYEWCGEKGARRPFRFRPRRGGLILFPALYEEQLDPKTNAWRRGFAILTTRPNAVVAPVHNRMPAIVLPEHRAQVDAWLAGGEMPRAELKALFLPAPDDLLLREAIGPGARHRGASPDEGDQLSLL